MQRYKARKRRAAGVKKLHSTDYKTVNGGGSAKVSALLCGVVMRGLMLDEIDSSTCKALIESVKGRGRFADLRLLLTQQSDLEALIEFMRARYCDDFMRREC